MAALTAVLSVYQLFLKNMKQFRLFSILSIVQLAIDWSSIAFVLIGDLRLLLVGLTLGWALRVLSYWLVVRRMGLFRLRLRLRWQRLKPMLGLGLPLSLWSLGYQSIVRLDSLVVASALGTTALGYYYLGPQVAAAVAGVPLALAVISYPNLMETYGAGGRESLRPHLVSYIRPIALVLSPAAVAVGAFGVGVLVKGFIPDFSPGLPAMRVFMLTLLFVQAGQVFIQVLVAERRVVLLLWLTAASLLLQGAFLGVGVALDLTLTWAAAAAVVGQAAFTLLLLVYNCRLLGVTRAEWTSFWARVPVAWAALAGLVLVLDWAAPTAGDVWGALAIAGAELAAFAAAGSLIVLVLDRAAFGESVRLLRGSG
jgi:O-antigen/teichoic acid export membrane protein